jgi:hypothetical protein
MGLRSSNAGGRRPLCAGGTGLPWPAAKAGMLMCSVETHCAVVPPPPGDHGASSSPTADAILRTDYMPLRRLALRPVPVHGLLTFSMVRIVSCQPPS